MTEEVEHVCKCGGKTKTTRPIKKCWECAYVVVLRVRGSNDVPCFDMCVEAEMEADLG